MKKLIFFLFLIGCTQIKNESENFNKEKVISNPTERASKLIINSPKTKIDNKKEFSEIDFSHILSKNYIKSLLKNGDSIKVLDTKFTEQLDSKIRVITEYKVIRNSEKKDIRMRLVADFDREKKILIKVVFHNQI
tara:strand:+ start:977 stop:1381 length:405 start_codon:yes stop_codon:yes gene_type:complete